MVRACPYILKLRHANILSGLLVREALSRLSQFIRDAPTVGQTSLRVITGKGLHSDNQQAQILPAVEESLRT